MSSARANRAKIDPDMEDKTKVIDRGQCGSFRVIVMVYYCLENHAENNHRCDLTIKQTSSENDSYECV